MPNNKPVFDYSKLRGRIVEKYGTNKKFCVAMHISNSTLSNKLSGVSTFSQPDILKAMNVLDIEPETVASYFFTVDG